MNAGILVFTGAGFSRSISDRFFTTQEFYERVEGLAGQRLWALKYVEDLLAADAESSGQVGGTFDVESLAKKISRALAAFKVVVPRDQERVAIGSHINCEASVLRRDLERLLRDIKAKVLENLDFDLLTDPEECTRIEEAQSFLESLASLGRLTVFSTNYDTLFPKQIYRGREEKQYYLDEYDRIDIDKLMEEGKPFSYIPLKGMLHWRPSIDEPDCFVQGNIRVNDVDKATIMAFEEDSAPDRQPHKKMYDKLESLLEDPGAISTLIFIGFSFSDLHINDIIESKVSNDHRAVVIVKDDSVGFAKKVKKEVFSSVLDKNLKYIPTGFDAASIKQALAFARKQK